MSRPLAETMPAVTVPPRPNGLPTATTQSPTRTAVLRELDVGELAVGVVDLEEREVGLLRRRRSTLRLVLGAVVEDDGERLPAVDDVVVGDDVAVFGDDEAGAEAHRERAALAAELTVAVAIAVIVAELTEETLHRSVVAAEFLERVDALSRDILARRRLDADADHRRADLLHHVGEAHRLNTVDANRVGERRGLRKNDRLAGDDAAHHQSGCGAEQRTLPERTRLGPLRRNCFVDHMLVSRPFLDAETPPQRLSTCEYGWPHLTGHCQAD